MLEQREFKAGDLTGTILNFEKGDELPSHFHDDNTNHIIIVTFGKFKLIGEHRDGPFEIIEATKRGTVKRLKPRQWHGLICIEPGSTTHIRERMVPGGN